MRKKPKRVRGDIVRIDLGDGNFGFGQVLAPPLFAFFDLRSGETPTIDRILESGIAFSILVMDYAVTDGDWPVIGHAEVPPEVNEEPPFFKQDPISGALSITYTGAEEEPATPDDIEGMECAAVWEPEHFVDRSFCRTPEQMGGFDEAGLVRRCSPSRRGFHDLAVSIRHIT